MTKTTILLISFLFFAQVAIAQLAPAPTTQWSKCYGGTEYDAITCMIEAHTDGFMIVGSSNSKDGNLDTSENKTTWVAKMDAEGKIVWQKYYGFENSGVIKIAKYPTSGYVLCGVSGDIGGDVTTNKGMADYWVVRINDTGKIIWQKSYGGSEGEGAWSIVVDKANNIYVGGSSTSYNGDIKNPHIQLPYVEDDIWIIKLDPDGNLIWEHSYGGTDTESLYDMCLTPDNNIIFCGRTLSANGDVEGNHIELGRNASLDAWAVKIDSTGAIRWQRPCGGSSSEIFRSIVATSDTGCVLVGDASSYDGDVKNHYPNRGYDAWVVKLSKDGEIEWQKCLGGNSFDEAETVALDNEGNYIIQANSTSKDGDIPVGLQYNKRSYLLKLNKEGNIVWKRFIGGTNGFYTFPNSFCNINVDKNNSIYGAGMTYANDFNANDNHNIDTLGFVGDGWITKFYPEIVPIKIIANNTLNIYPNPAKEAVYIATQNIKEIRFIDILGRVYFNQKIDNTITTGYYYLPLNYIANDTYMVQAVDTEGVVRTGKLVVMK